MENPMVLFAPAETIDRGSAAKIMAIMLELEINKNAKPSFQDAQNHWAAPWSTIHCSC